MNLIKEYARVLLICTIACVAMIFTQEANAVTVTATSTTNLTCGVNTVMLNSDCPGSTLDITNTVLGISYPAFVTFDGSGNATMSVTVTNSFGGSTFALDFTDLNGACALPVTSTVSFTATVCSGTINYNPTSTVLVCGANTVNFSVSSCAPGTVATAISPSAPAGVTIPSSITFDAAGNASMTITIGNAYSGSGFSISLQTPSTSSCGSTLTFVPFSVQGCGAFDCPALSANFGDPCNDGNPNTIGETIQMNCTCGGGTVQTVTINSVTTSLVCGMNTVNLSTTDCASFTANISPPPPAGLNYPSSVMFDAAGNASFNFDVQQAYAGTGLILTFTTFSFDGCFDDTSPLTFTITPCPVFDCPALGLNFGDACTDSTGDASTVDMTCTCTEVYDCPTVNADFGDPCIDSDGDVSAIDAMCMCPEVLNCPSLGLNIGDPCTDAMGNPATVNSNCMCSATFDCPIIMMNIGDACSDGSPATTGETIQPDCTCAGGTLPTIALTANTNALVCGTNTISLSTTSCSTFLATLSAPPTFISHVLTLTFDAFGDAVLTINVGANYTGGPFSLAISTPSTSSCGPTMTLVNFTVTPCTTFDCPAQSANIGDACIDSDGDASVIDGFCSCVEIYDCPTIGADFGDSCNDGNPGTINDQVDANCICVGTINPNFCSALGLNVGDSCNDFDACTTGDVVDASCNCVGVFQDNDGDGTCDVQDVCAGGPEPGDACSDGNSATVNDTIDANCNCVGVVNPNFCPSFNGFVGDACDDMDNTTINDVLVTGCTCAGTPDPNYCPTYSGFVGDPCDDMNIGTINDVIVGGCICLGSADPNFCTNLNLPIGAPCDDGFVLTTNDVVNSACICEGVNTASSGFELKVVLEGYLQNSGTMSTGLLNFGLIPMQQPYNTSPYNYSGVETVITMPANIVDWVLVELRSQADPSLVVSRRAFFLRSDGHVVDFSGNTLLNWGAISGNFYVSVNHRSHIGVISAQPVNITSGVTYDFTSGVAQALGDTQQKMVYGIATAVAGDFNGSGINNILDFLMWYADQSSVFVYTNYDADGNGLINILDFQLWFINRSQVGLPEIQY